MTGARGSHVAVVGGGLAGIAAALDAADAGARVTLLERRARLGGLTWSFPHDGRSIDNGQHVFLRCCTGYLGFLRRIGSGDDVTLQRRLRIPVIKAAAGGGEPLRARLARNGLPAPMHLGPALARYRLLPPADRARIGLAAVPLRSADLADPALDTETFASWLARHGQRPAAIEALWDLVTVATVNLPAAEASAAVGAKVFQTGLLTDSGAADIGWSSVPLGQLHGAKASIALAAAGVDVRLGERVGAVTAGPGGWSVATGGGSLDADAVVVALPHLDAAGVLPGGSVPAQDRLAALGTSAIVDVHVLYDRPVTELSFAAAIGTRAQWVFDRTAASGLDPEGSRQYLAASLSAAEDVLGTRPEALARSVVADLERLFPAARSARVLDTLVTKERSATFRAAPGTAPLRAGARSAHPALAIAGAWTDTGWPATMEGAVRSGHAAARAALADLTADRRLPEEVA